MVRLPYKGVNVGQEYGKAGKEERIGDIFHPKCQNGLRKALKIGESHSA